jgi:hypothetical protein
MLKIIKWNLLFILSNPCSGLVVKTFMHFLKSWVQTLMNACIDVCNVYIPCCIMYKYSSWNIYDDGEYFQNILLKIPNQNANNNNNVKSQCVFLSQHVVKNLQFVIEKEKKKTCYIMTRHINSCHITLGPHNIHVHFFKLQIT